MSACPGVNLAIYCSDIHENFITLFGQLLFRISVKAGKNYAEETFKNYFTLLNKIRFSRDQFVKISRLLSEICVMNSSVKFVQMWQADSRCQLATRTACGIHISPNNCST